MVIVNIFAGLGNQMFQYATGRRLARKLGVELKLDLSSFDRCQFRKYQLNLFQIPERVATRQEVESIKGPEQVSLPGRVLRKAHKVINPRIGFRLGGLVAEKHFHFDPSILTLGDQVYLFGLWQSPKYFDDTAALIREEFTLKEAPAGKNRALAGEMKAQPQSVSLHVRRGDYVSDPHSNQSHGVCGADYYHRAIAHMAERLPQAHFYIFSDDVDWARSNLQLPRPATFIDHNGPDKGVEDLRLMGQCRHHVIANSSFSWWGAWLNPDPEKRVCAPGRWFGENAKVRRQSKDILPDNWTVL